MDLLESSSDEEGRKPVRLYDYHEEKRKKEAMLSRGAESSSNSSSGRGTGTTGVLSSARSRLSTLVSREKILRSKDKATKGTASETKTSSPPRQIHQMERSRFNKTRSMSPNSSSRFGLHGPIAAANNANQQYDHELMRRLDARAFLDISKRISAQCTRILDSPDLNSIKHAFRESQRDFAGFGICQMQLWFASETDGCLETTALDGLKVSINQEFVGALVSDQYYRGGNRRRGDDIDFAGSEESSSSIYYQQDPSHRKIVAAHGMSFPKEEKSLGGIVATVRPEDATWGEFEQAIRLVGAGPEGSPESKRWYAIHIITPFGVVPSEIMNANGGYNKQPYLLVAESMSAASSIGISMRMTNSSPVQVKSLYVLQCFQNMFSTTCLRISQLQNQASEIVHVRALTDKALVASQESTRVRYESALTQVDSMGEAAKLLSICGNELTRQNVWVLLPLTVAEGSSPLAPRIARSQKAQEAITVSGVSYRIYSGHRGGDDVTTNLCLSEVPRMAEDGGVGTATVSNLLLSKLVGDHSDVSQLFSSISATELSEAHLYTKTPVTTEGWAEDIEAEETEERDEYEETKSDKNDGDSRKFVVQSMCTSLLTSSLHDSTEGGSYLSLHRRYEQAIIITATPRSVSWDADCTNHSDIRTVVSLARGVFRRLHDAGQEALSRRLERLPGDLLTIDYSSNSRSMATQPLPSSGENRENSGSKQTVMGAVQAFGSSLQMSPSSLSAFGSHRNVLLFTNQFTNSIATLDALANEDSFADGLVSFSQVDTTTKELVSLSQQGDVSHVSHVLEWMQDLDSGRIVVYRHGESTDIGGHDELSSVMRACDAETRTAFLLPLRAAAGLCVLVVVVETDQSLKNQDLESITVCSSSLGQRGTKEVYASSLVCDSLARALNTVHCLHKGQLSSFSREKALTREKSLYKVLNTHAQKRSAADAFHRWRNSKLSMELVSANQLLQAAENIIALDLTQPIKALDRDRGILAGSQGGEDEDLEEESTINPDGADGGYSFDSVLGGLGEDSALSAFLRGVVHQVASLFPQCSLDARLGGPRGAVAAQFKRGAYAVLHKSDISDTSGRSNYLLGVVRAEGDVLAHVRVQLSPNSEQDANAPFQNMHVRNLERLMEMSSKAYSAFKRGLESPRTKGNVQGLLLPLLHSLLPLLTCLPTLSSEGSESEPYGKIAESADEMRKEAKKFRGLLEKVALVFKYLCGGEVALVRAPYHSLEGDVQAHNALQADKRFGSGMDCHVSSEEVEGHRGSLASLLEAVDVDSPADTLAAFANLIKNESVRYDDEEEDAGKFRGVLEVITLYWWCLILSRVAY